MKIGGIDMPIVDEDFNSKVEFACANACQDWDDRMMELGISIPLTIMQTMHELMCVAAMKTVMGMYDESE